MRYFLTLAYLGTNFHGWQEQPHTKTVQGTLREALETILREPIELMGCGRTDAGVHARYYVAHFDAERPLPETFLIGINSILPADIAVYQVEAVAPDAHARFNARLRSYEYHISTRKDPFHQQTSWFYPQSVKLDLHKMQETAALLLHYEDFYPFCKTHSDVDTYRCTLHRSEWEIIPEAHKLIFHISANRFLRGMVRLVVGACIQVSQNHITLNEVKKALDEQQSLSKSLSVPPDGLFLTEVVY